MIFLHYTHKLQELEKDCDVEVLFEESVISIKG